MPQDQLCVKCSIVAEAYDTANIIPQPSFAKNVFYQLITPIICFMFLKNGKVSVEFLVTVDGIVF